MNKILESKYFSLALATVIAVVVFFVAKATEDVPIFNVAAFAFFVALCCAGAWMVATFFTMTKQDIVKSKAIGTYGVLGSLLGTIIGLLLACL